MTRTTRKLIIAKLTALGGSRRIWSNWIRYGMRHYAFRPESLKEHPSVSMIRHARELLNS